MDENKKIMIGGGTDWSIIEAEEAIETLMCLCSWIHENNELIPQKVLDEINDLVYKNFSP